MGWSCGRNGSLKSDKESRCPEKGNEMRKTTMAMGGCTKRDLERVAEEWIKEHQI